MLSNEQYKLVKPLLKNDLSALDLIRRSRIRADRAKDLFNELYKADYLNFIGSSYPECLIQLTSTGMIETEGHKRLLRAERRANISLALSIISGIIALVTFFGSLFGILPIV